MAGNRVANKTALITGASSGMGKADAFLLSKEGAKVFLTDIDEVNGQKIADKINELSANDHAAHFIKHDVSKEKDWKHVIEEISNISDNLDILVNNAGIMKTAHLDQLSLEDWRMLNSINSESQFLGCKYAIPLMEKNGNGGSIINMSSTSMIMGISNIPAYSASKGAVTSYTRALAKEFGPDGIRVNAITAGMTSTRFHDDFTSDEIRKKVAGATPLRREGKPEEIADLAMYLASDSSSYITGANIDINGGILNS